MTFSSADPTTWLLLPLRLSYYDSYYDLSTLYPFIFSLVVFILFKKTTSWILKKTQQKKINKTLLWRLVGPWLGTKDKQKGGRRENLLLSHTLPSGEDATPPSVLMSESHWFSSAASLSVISRHSIHGPLLPCLVLLWGSHYYSFVDATKKARDGTCGGRHHQRSDPPDGNKVLRHSRISGKIL